MTAALIILGIIALFCLFLCLRLRLTVTWANELFLRPALGFISFEISVNKVIKWITSLTEEDTEKKEKKKKKNRKKKEKEPTRPLTKEEILTLLTDGISLIRDLLKKAYKHFAKKLRVERYVLKVSVSTDDPAQTAIVYGAVSGAMASLTQAVLMYRHKKTARIFSECKPDFISGETDIYVDIGFSVMLWNLLITAVLMFFRILKTLVKYGIGYLKYKRKKKAEQ